MDEESALMAGQVSVGSMERLQLQQGLAGDAAALAALREQYHSNLRAILISRGATETEAEDLLADLWGDCVPNGDERLSLLEKFSARCALKTWLITVVTNRLYDLKRRHNLPLGGPSRTANACDFQAGGGILEYSLVDLLRRSLEQSFAGCTAEDLLMLRLVYLHDVTQREVARIWGWHESKVSRCLARALDDIRSRTLQRIKQTDPWMELSWQDFVDLCETHQIGFL